MRKTFLTYTIFTLLCCFSSGCATNMKSNKVGIGQNLPTNIASTTHKIPVQNNNYASIPLVNLGNFINAYNKTLNNNEAMIIADAIIQMSNKHRVDYKIITALVAIESGFRMTARSPSGAMGLGQLMPGTARHLNVQNPFDPFDNLNGAVSLLRTHLEKYNGDINFALGAYKMGAGTVSRAGISQDTTAKYIKNIRNVYDKVP